MTVVVARISKVTENIDSVLNEYNKVGSIKKQKREIVHNKRGITDNKKVKETKRDDAAGVHFFKRFKNENTITYIGAAAASILILLILSIGYFTLTNHPKNAKDTLNQKATKSSTLSTIVSTGTTRTSQLDSTTIRNTEYLSSDGYYIVKRGDSLSAISKKVYDNSSKYKDIMEKNNITDPTSIKEGQKLIIPW